MNGSSLLLASLLASVVALLCASYATWMTWKKVRRSTREKSGTLAKQSAALKGISAWTHIPTQTTKPNGKALWR